jgi:MraZ protein
MFEKRSNHTLDKKGRLSIPKRFMDELARMHESSLVVTNYGECLRVYRENDWNNLREQAANTDEFDPDAISFLRCFISGATKCPIRGNRITIPLNLRKDAGLTKGVVIVGLLDKFEIWDKEKWDSEFQQGKKNLAKASRSLKIHKRGKSTSGTPKKLKAKKIARRKNILDQQESPLA